jgi:hypothetical protein
MTTAHSDSTGSRASQGPDYRPLLHALLAGGGVYLLWRLARGIGNLFWTIFGLAFAFYWVWAGRGFPW